MARIVGELEMNRTISPLFSMCNGNKRFILEIPTSQQIILILKFLLTSALNNFLAFY